MKTKTTRYPLIVFVLLLLPLVLAACDGGPSAPANDETNAEREPAPERDAQTITLVSSNTWWDGIHLPTYVAKAVLEDELGYTVNVINAGSVPEFFQEIASGRADLLVSGWFPTNDFSFERHPNLVRIGRIYGGEPRDAFEGWMASNAFARQYDVESLADLFDPNVVQALDDDGDGRGTLLGCPEAWACSERHVSIMEDYGLSNAYELVTFDSEEAMLNTLNRRLSNNQPSVFYMYTPATFPETGALDDVGVWLTGTEPYLPLAFNRGVMRSEMIASHPDVAHVVKQMRIPGAAVGEAMRRIANEGNNPATLESIADEWIQAHQAEVQSWLPQQAFTPSVATTWPTALPEGTLPLAYTRDKEDLFLELVTAYNLNREADTPPIHPIPTAMSEMLDDAMSGWYGAISPDSTIWVSQLDRMWQDANPDASPLVGTVERYALSPVVIAMLEERADEFGYPDEAISWTDIMTFAQENPGFRWSHPSASTATGLLTLAAEFYAAAGKTNDLTVADVESDEAIEYVTEIEATINLYGAESEDRVITRNLAAGGRQLDAFVTQEQKVIFFNQNSPSTRLVAAYPEEGTFWMDHPLILLDGDWVTDDQRRVFREFANFVEAEEQQQRVMQHGYRPADVSIALDAPESLITADFNVDPDQPRSLLQVPTSGVIEAIREAWLLTKRPASIVLVADVSGSMEGQKLAGAKAALLSFIDQIESERDHVALVAFSDRSNLVQNLGPLDRERMIASIRDLEAGGGTQLYDAIGFALDLLNQEEETGRAQVVIAMTDGQSEGSVSVVESRLANMQGEGTTLIYTVGYGDDADMSVLRRLAQMGDGRVYPSDPETISRLYALLSEFF